MAYVQENQPDGVPPLELTGERTLPDVPEENYWYRRHVAVYEWIAARIGGLARRRPRLRRGLRLGTCSPSGAARSSGSTRTPRPTSTPALATARPNLSFERGLVEEFSEPCDAIVFLQTIEHIHEPGEAAGGDRRGRAGRLHLDAEPPDAGPGGRREVGEPLAPARVHGGRVPRAARAALLARSSCSACSTPASCACTRSRSTWAGTASTRRCGSRSPSTTASPRRSPPPTSPCARMPRSRLDEALDFLAICRCVSARARTGDLALVLHSHMPYVEGFGTYPFGEEWLFDARPALLPAGAGGRRQADDDGDAGAGRPARGAGPRRAAARLRRGVPARLVPARRRGGRAGLARRGASPRPTATAAASPASTSSAAIRSPPSPQAERRGPGRADDLDRDPRRAAAARDPGRAAACRSTPAFARTAAASASPPASGCPSAHTSPGWRGPGRARASAPSASTRAAHEQPRRGAAADRDGGGPGRASPSTGRRSRGCGRSRAIPPIPLHTDFHRESLRGARPWSIGGEPRDPEAARRGRASRRASSSPRSQRGWRAHRERRGQPRPARLRDRHRAARATGGGRARTGWPR